MYDNVKSLTSKAKVLRSPPRSLVCVGHMVNSFLKLYNSLVSQSFTSVYKRPASKGTIIMQQVSGTYTQRDYATYVIPSPHEGMTHTLDVMCLHS